MLFSFFFPFKKNKRTGGCVVFRAGGLLELEARLDRVDDRRHPGEKPQLGASVACFCLSLFLFSLTGYGERERERERVKRVSKNEQSKTEKKKLQARERFVLLLLGHPPEDSKASSAAESSLASIAIT